MHVLGYKEIWKSLKRNNLPKNIKKEMTLDQQSFKRLVQKKLKSLSKEIIERDSNGGKVYEFKQIKTREFYEYVGKDYCKKPNGTGGYYYLDNVRIIYRYSSLSLTFHYSVNEMDSNGNHVRFRPVEG